jgi:hypothetical protein
LNDHISTKWENKQDFKFRANHICLSYISFSIK